MIRQLTYGIAKRLNFTTTRQILLGPSRHKPTGGRSVHPFATLPPDSLDSDSDTGCRIKTMAESEQHHHKHSESPKKMTREQVAIKEKEKYLRMPLSKKREMYRCKERFNTLNSVPTWPAYYKDIHQKTRQQKNQTVNQDINEKVSIWRGDITSLEIDVIVNAANNSLLGGGGVDGAIHTAAGSSLRVECANLHGCDTGYAKITGGYKLPAKYIIHTVGPIGKNKPMLEDCYKRCLNVMKQNKLTSIAFPCISTGIYGYPNESAVRVALSTVREFLEKDEYSEKVEQVIFCLFLPVDVDLYEKYMQHYFPLVLEEPSHEVSAANGEAKPEESPPKEKVSDIEVSSEMSQDEGVQPKSETDTAASAEPEDTPVDTESGSSEKPTDNPGDNEIKKEDTVPTEIMHVDTESDSPEKPTDNPGDNEPKKKKVPTATLR